MSDYLDLVNCDTDSITVCKKDGGEWSKEERIHFLEQINSLFPDKILWEDDGYFESITVVKAKNYVLYDGGSLKIKGSALKATMKEPALREMLHRLIKSMMGLEEKAFSDIYHEYVIEASDIKDIQRWSSKYSVTEAVLTPKRKQEQDKLDAIKGEGLQLGEKFFAFFAENGRLCLTKNYKGCYHKDKIYQKIFDTARILQSIYDVKALIPNYKLKRNKNILEEMLDD